MPATGSGRSRTTRARYLGQVDLWRAMISSDNSVYAQLTNIVGPKAIVRTAHRARHPLRPARVLLDRARLRRGQPARHDARLRDDRERGQARRRLDHARPAARRSQRPLPQDRQGLRERARRARGALDGRGRDDHGDPRAGRRAGNRDARAARRPHRGGQDGDDGRLRRRLVRRLHARPRRRRLGRLPERAPPDGDRVPRRAGRRRHAAGADLEGVHDERRTRTSCRSRSTPRRTSPPTDVRVVFRDGKWRLDNGYCPNTRVDRVLRRPGAGDDGVVLRERGVGAGARRALGGVGAGRAPVGPADGGRRLRPGEAAHAAGSGRAAEARGGGFLSANGSVRLWVSAAQNGLVPNLVGSSLPDARERTRKLRAQAADPLRRRAVRHGASSRASSRGSLRGPGCRSRCSSGATRPASPGLDVPPRQLRRARDADARRPLDAGTGVVGRHERERRGGEVRAVVRRR